MDWFTSAWNDYLERKFRSLVQELKEKGCLSEEFEVMTQAEYAQKVQEAFNNLGDSSEGSDIE